MDWKHNIRRWRALPAAEQHLRSLHRSPTHVWQSMTFEREAVSLNWLEARHHKLTMQPAASLPRSGD